MPFSQILQVHPHFRYAMTHILGHIETRRFIHMVLAPNKTTHYNGDKLKLRHS